MRWLFHSFCFSLLLAQVPHSSAEPTHFSDAIARLTAAGAQKILVGSAPDERCHIGVLSHVLLGAHAGGDIPLHLWALTAHAQDEERLDLLGELSHYNIAKRVTRESMILRKDFISLLGRSTRTDDGSIVEWFRQHPDFRELLLSDKFTIHPLPLTRPAASLRALELFLRHPSLAIALQASAYHSGPTRISRRHR